jgi:hypothetical protein
MITELGETCPCQKLHPHGLDPDVTLLHPHPILKAIEGREVNVAV